MFVIAPREALDGPFFGQLIQVMLHLGWDWAVHGDYFYQCSDVCAARIYSKQ